MYQIDKKVALKDGKKNIPSYFRNDFKKQRERNNPYGTRGTKSVISTKDLNITEHLNTSGIELIEEDPLARQYAKERALRKFRQKRNIVKTGSVLLPLVARNFIPRTYKLRTNDRLPDHNPTSSEEDSDDDDDDDDDEDGDAGGRRHGKRKRRRPSKFDDPTDAPQRGNPKKHVDSEEGDDELFDLDGDSNASDVSSSDDPSSSDPSSSEDDEESVITPTFSKKSTKKNYYNDVSKKRKHSKVPKYLVERILSRRGEGRTLELLVKWYGLGKEMCTWEYANSFTAKRVKTFERE